MSDSAGTSRSGRCLACGAGAKPGDAQAVNCPRCGLTLLRVPGTSSFAPAVIPAVSREDAWRALARMRRLEAVAGVAEIRSARILMVPFWRQVDEGVRSVSRPGVVLSAAELLPVGLPGLSPSRQQVAGLDVERRTRTGDALGRLEENPGRVDAGVVAVVRGPGGLSGLEALEAAAAPSAGGWTLYYYPVWSFHYVFYSKEYFHVVDATTGRPVGPAREVSWPLVAWTAAASQAGAFLAALPLIGAAAALPAWLVSLGVMRWLLRRQRRA